MWNGSFPNDVFKFYYSHKKGKGNKSYNAPKLNLQNMKRSPSKYNYVPYDWIFRKLTIMTPCTYKQEMIKIYIYKSLNLPLDKE